MIRAEQASHVDDVKPEDLDEPMGEDEEDIPPPPPPPPAPPAPPVPVEPETPVIIAPNFSPTGVVPAPPPPPPVPIAAGVTTVRDPFEDEYEAVNTRVPDTESEVEADPDQPKARSVVCQRDVFINHVKPQCMHVSLVQSHHHDCTWLKEKAR